MRKNHTNDVRPLSYDAKSAKANGQSEFEIRVDASIERILRSKHLSLPSRYYLLMHLGLYSQAMDAAVKYKVI